MKLYLSNAWTPTMRRYGSVDFISVYPIYLVSNIDGTNQIDINFNLQSESHCDR
jgi:hypothetical protein